MSTVCSRLGRSLALCIPWSPPGTAPATVGQVRVALLGSLEIEDGDRRIGVGGSRLQSLLVRLALEPGRTVTTVALVDAVWEDDLPSDEIHALQSLVSRLRRALGDAAHVEQTAGGYRLAVEPDAVDALRFERSARAGAAALRDGDLARAATLTHDALELWRGPALAGLAGRGRFATEAALRLDDLRVGAQLDRAEAELGLTGDGAAAVAELERLAAERPLDERVARLLIRALHAAGRQADALAGYERIRGRLDEELGALPSSELQAAHVAVLRGERATPAVAAPARTNLPAQLTSFVGREAELERVGGELRQHRLVTLIGPGGAGKTRLAQETAARCLDQVADGAWLVELAPVGDDEEIVQVLLSSLRLREVALLEGNAAVAWGDAMQRVLDGLADQTVLIVLDNCEHLIGGAAHAADAILRHCAGVRILATSREPLGIVGERLVDVPPLTWPQPGAGAAEALAHPAVRLFADRAAAARPGFAVDDDSVAAVVEICRRLDGLPLAIELAAARTRSLSVDQVAERLDDRFRLLTGGSRTAMPRHRTLRAVVDWSWDLLSEPERALAARLAMFPAGVTPESAAAVCATPPVAADDVLDLLAALVDRSLLHVVDPDAPRYRMLETIREYGIEKLDARDELAAVRDAHARYFAELVEELEPRLRTADQLGPYAVLTAERENALAALRHLADRGDGGRALSLAVSLLWFATLSGQPGEALGWLRIARAAPGDADPTDRTIAEGILAVVESEEARAARGDEPDRDAERTMAAEAAARLEGIDTTRRPLLAFAAPVLAWLGGDRVKAEQLLAAARRHSDPWVRAAAPLVRSQLAENDGDLDTVRRETAQALAAFRALGERWGLSTSLVTRAGALLVDGDLVGAAAALDEARRLSGELGALARDAMLRLRLAEVQLRRGDAAAARRHLAELEHLHDLSPEETIIVLATRARIALCAGDRDEVRAIHEQLAPRLEQQAGSARPERGHARSMGLAAMAFVALQDGDAAAAERLLEDAYAAALGTTDMPIVAAVGVVVAHFAERQGQLPDAAEMLGAAAVVRGAEDVGDPEISALLQRLRAALGDAELEAAYARGRETPRDAALARLRPASLDAPAVRP
jgi:predicted ATPase/DNA-binding SARP family transcriptional activator